MANLNIQKLQSPYLRDFFEDIFDGTTAVEGISVQDDKSTNPISFVTSAPVNAVAATGTLTFSGVVSDTETVTIGDDVYEFDTDASVTEGNILVDVSGGATASAAVTALVAAIVASDTQGVGAADGDGDTVVLTADTAGTAANSIATTETCANGSFAAATLEGGVDSTIGVKGQMYVDASYLYVNTAASTVSTTNWKRVSLGTAY
jgi:hypothetical protein